jgi:hypothetical protein
MLKNSKIFFNIDRKRYEEGEEHKQQTLRRRGEEHKQQTL